MPLEKRRWFQRLVAISAYVVTFICAAVIHFNLPAGSNVAATALVLLGLAALLGFVQVFNGLFPMVLKTIVEQ